MSWRITAILILLVFYAVYIGKMILQRKKGIRTDQIAKRQRRDSWRAGIAEEDKREMITSGIYKISRNPAFLGFDCVYLGILLMFFNWILLAASVFAALMLHLQILQEEKYLPAAFGEAYISYKKCVRRYLGRKE